MAEGMKLKFLLLAVLAVTAWGSVLAQSTGPSASPEGARHGQWGHGQEGFLEKLNLSDDQRNQIKKFRADNKGAFRTAMLNLLTAEKSLQDAIYKSPGDEATISSLSASVNSARTQLTMQRAKLTAMIAGLLTPEQRQIWEEMHRKQQDRLQKRIDHLNQAPPGEG
jgi:Spy/CpxP family protein refolding chaperone